MPLKKTGSGLVPILLFLVFTFAGNLFYQSGKVIVVLGSVAVTDEGLRIASIRMFRVFDLIYAAKILTHITPLETMIDSLRKVLHPLEKIGLPIHDFFSIVTLTLQCFPVLVQKLYGKYSGVGNKRSLKAIASFVIPLFVESMADPEKFFTDMKGER